MELTTSEGPYDFMYLDLDEPVDFGLNPKYRVKVYAPFTGGDVLLKFENSDNTEWQEILMTPEPGQWDDLEFDFSGLEANNLTRMVIFVDFLGTIPGIHWYVDDVIHVIDSVAGFTSSLPIVMINTGGQSIPDEPKMTAHMGIINNGNGLPNSITDDFNDYDGFIGIELRGQSSQMYPKKSYGLETRDSLGENLNVSLLGMPAENDWILYAPYSDKSMMRNTITFNLAQNLKGYASRTAYCEVFLNNDYQGIYVLMEKIKRDNDRVDIERLDPDEISSPELTGGYIIKVDKIDDDFVYGQDGWLSSPMPSYPNAMDITFQYYYPKADVMTAEQKLYIKDYVTDAEAVLIGNDFNDPALGYYNYLDVTTFVDHIIMRELSKEVDSYRYSTFFYKENLKDGGKLAAGPIWDFNLGYGNVNYWGPGVNVTGWVFDDVYPVDWSIIYWWDRLMTDPYFKDLLKTRWTNLREGTFSNNALVALVDSLESSMGDAIDRNYDRWPILGEWVWPNFFIGNTWEEERQYFQDFLLERADWMDDNMPGGILQPEAHLSGVNNELILQLEDDFFNALVLDKKHFELLDAPPGLVIDTVICVHAAKAHLSLSGVVTGIFQVALSIQADVLNGFDDLTSNSLVLTGTYQQKDYSGKVSIRTTSGMLHIVCSEPALLPDRVELYSMAGQRVGVFQIGKSTQNRLKPVLAPGLYMLKIELDSGMLVEKFSWH
jgi:hypothetical protein